MTMQTSALVLAVMVLLVGGPAASDARGQPYAIDWYTIDGGGGVSAGGSYTLSGTVGQPDAGTLSGDSYTLQGGFWPGLIVSTPGLPTLYIQLSGNNVIISWSPSGNGFALEMTGSLSPADWSPAPGGNPVPLPASETARFYRLKRP